MKTEKNINPQSTDTNKTNPVTTGSSHLNQEPTKTPGKEEKEQPWTNPDPTKPEKGQDIYAGKKESSSMKRENDEDLESTADGDTENGPDAKYTGNSGSQKRQQNDVEKDHEGEDEI